MRLEKAVQKVRKLLASPTAPALDVVALRALLHPDPPARISATEGGATHLFNAKRITRFFASAQYVAFCHEGREHLVEESRSDLETRLTPHGFLRTHRGELVNLSAIRSLRTDDSGTTILLEDQQQARVSRRLVADLKRALGIR